MTDLEILDADVITYPKDAHIALSNGKAVPLGMDRATPVQILDQLKRVTCLPYKGSDDDKFGMTLLEAALYSAAKKAADGDTDALEKLLNRLMGKPVQQVQNLNVSTSLKDLLENIVQNEEIQAPVLDSPPSGDPEIDPLGD